VVKSVSVTSQGIVAAATASNTTFTELSPGGTTPRTPRCRCGGPQVRPSIPPLGAWARRGQHLRLGDVQLESRLGLASSRG
jgi:hypothetical protein